MRKLRKLGIGMIIGMLGLSSCSPKYYVSNTQNVPLLSEKGEVDLTVSGNTDKVEFQGSFAATDHLGIQANGGIFIPADMDNGDGGSGKFVELGLGYFTQVRESEKLIFETYGLVGFGTMENHFPSSIQDNPTTTGNISSNIYRIGVQPNFGYKSEHFAIALSSRFVYLGYDNISGNLMFQNERQVEYLRDHNSHFLIEPALTIKGGFEKIKLQLQYGYSFNVTDDNFRQEHPFISLGLNFNLR